MPRETRAPVDSRRAVWCFPAPGPAGWYQVSDQQGGRRGTGTHAPRLALLADGGRADLFDVAIALANEYSLASRVWLTSPQARKIVDHYDIIVIEDRPPQQAWNAEPRVPLAVAQSGADATVTQTIRGAARRRRCPRSCLVRRAVHVRPYISNCSPGRRARSRVVS
jgi:hypothetical protein